MGWTVRRVWRIAGCWLSDPSNCSLEQRRLLLDGVPQAIGAKSIRRVARLGPAARSARHQDRAAGPRLAGCGGRGKQRAGAHQQPAQAARTSGHRDRPRTGLSLRGAIARRTRRAGALGRILRCAWLAARPISAGDSCGDEPPGDHSSCCWDAKTTCACSGPSLNLTGSSPWSAPAALARAGSRRQWHMPGSVAGRTACGWSNSRAWLTAALLPHAIAQPLGLHVPEGDASVQALADALANKEMLLVVDNCEHLVEPVATLVDRMLKAALGAARTGHHPGTVAIGRRTAVPRRSARRATRRFRGGRTWLRLAGSVRVARAIRGASLHAHRAGSAVCHRPVSATRRTSPCHRARCCARLDDRPARGARAGARKIPALDCRRPHGAAAAPDAAGRRWTGAMAF